ncbi:MAG: tRNA (guanine(46)-N(7))-methyltransferase TrmB [Chthoniobacterales bacterium]
MASCSGAVPGAETETTVAADNDAAIFPAEQPLVLDLGCGNGLFLAALAASEPGWNILGIEKKDYRVRQARRRARDLANARIVQGEVSEVLAALSDSTISRIYLLFSDPWPKRRHAVRRLVQDDFVALVGSKLANHGMFFFATDAAEYLDWAKERFTAAGWKLADWMLPAGWPMTEFEQRFVADGVSIGRFQAQR